MEGGYYLLTVWAAWIYGYFIVGRDNRLRRPGCLLALLLIILFPVELKVSGFAFSASAFLLAILCWSFIAMLPTGKKFYIIFTVITGMFGYTGFQFAALYDPVILIIDPSWIIVFSLFVFSYLFFPRSLLSRLVFVVLVLLQGETLFASLFSRVIMEPKVGSGQVMDMIATTLFAQTAVHLAGRLAEMAFGGNRHKVYK